MNPKLKTYELVDGMHVAWTDLPSDIREKISLWFGGFSLHFNFRLDKSLVELIANIDGVTGVITDIGSYQVVVLCGAIFDPEYVKSSILAAIILHFKRPAPPQELPKKAQKEWIN